jgi:hypothetical protein
VTKFSIISIFPGRHWKESTTLLLFAMARHGVTSLYWLYAKICWYGAEGYKNRHDRSYCRTLQVCLWKLVKLSVLECTFFYYRVNNCLTQSFHCLSTTDSWTHILMIRRGNMVLKATSNNISVISWRSFILVEETCVLGKSHWHVACHWQIVSHSMAVINVCLTDGVLWQSLV